MWPFNETELSILICLQLLSLLLAVYSLQQFVKGCGSFAMEMADAILNSLTNGRHTKFLESVKKDGAKKATEEKLEVKYNYNYVHV